MEAPRKNTRESPRPLDDEQPPRGTFESLIHACVAIFALAAAWLSIALSRGHFGRILADSETEISVLTVFLLHPAAAWIVFVGLLLAVGKEFSIKDHAKLAFWNHVALASAAALVGLYSFTVVRSFLILLS
ncbi:MAG: hypothetical protein N2C14_25745 [Planctomycetales bacterium]